MKHSSAHDELKQATLRRVTMAWDPSGRTGDPSEWEPRFPWENWASDKERYLMGGCGPLAGELHARTGWPMHAIYDTEPDDPEWEGEAMQPSHIFVQHPSGQMLDVRGLSPMPDPQWTRPIDHHDLADLMADEHTGTYEEHPSAGAVADALLREYPESP